MTPWKVNVPALLAEGRLRGALTPGGFTTQGPSQHMAHKAPNPDVTDYSYQQSCGAAMPCAYPDTPLSAIEPGFENLLSRSTASAPHCELTSPDLAHATTAGSLAISMMLKTCALSLQTPVRTHTKLCMYHGSIYPQTNAALLGNQKCLYGSFSHATCARGHHGRAANVAAVA